METTQDSERLALLMDAVNAQSSIVEGLLAEIANYGKASMKRVYGDRTLPNLGGWKAMLRVCRESPRTRTSTTETRGARPDGR